jgi:hypothetical protein
VLGMSRRSTRATAENTLASHVDVDYYHRKDPRELITELKKISS